MGLKFTPKAAEEGTRSARALLPEGIYDFTVLEAEEKKSKNGNDMISLKIGVFDDKGNERWMFDNLMAMESMVWKIQHFCETTGLTKVYESGELTAQNCIGRSGKCQVIQKIENYGTRAGQMVNKINDYGVGDVVEGDAGKGKKSEDDDVPW